MNESEQLEQPIILHGPVTGDVTELGDIDLPPAPAAVSIEAPRPADVYPSPAPAAAATVAPASERAFGLDALRGLLLLAMNFAFTIPLAGPFPGWMYHMQVPAGGDYVNQPGLTWRDMMYPGFLFTMSAALPITMSARLAKGMPYPRLAWIAIRRGVLLLLFAMLIGHVNPYWTNDYTKTGNIAAIFGLLVAFAVFVRPHREWSQTTTRVLRYTAWAGVATVLFIIPAWYGQTFSPERQDGVIASIAFLTVAGTLVWLATRLNTVARLAILGVVIGGRAIAPRVEWFAEIWNWTPAQWLYQPWYLELLVIAIPGTIVGDLLVQWMRRPADERLHWTRGRLMAIAAIGFSVIPILAIGLYERRHPGATAAAIVMVCALWVALTRKPISLRDYVLARLAWYTALILTVGVLVEPLEGGIRKDPQTLGYLVLMTGAAAATLTGLLILVDVLRARQRLLRPLVEVGQNPLFAYVVMFLGILHLLWLFNAGNFFTATWQQATVRGLLLTTLVGWMVWVLTRKRLLWRA
jgi:uncharacterized membrane protein YjfL (UPF0719 family)